VQAYSWSPARKPDDGTNRHPPPRPRTIEEALAAGYPLPPKGLHGTERSTPDCHRMGTGVWFTHMKTTVEIADPLFESARRLAARQGVTMRSLIEEGLRSVLQAHRAAPRRFVLRDASFAGDGVASGVALGDWSQLRSLIYDLPAD